MDKEFISQLLNEEPNEDIKLKTGKFAEIKLPNIPMIKQTEDVSFVFQLTEKGNFSSDSPEVFDGNMLPKSLRIKAVKPGHSEIRIIPIDYFTNEPIEGIEPYIIKIDIVE